MEIAKLKELLEYDCNSGLFIWKKSRNGVRKGDVAGTISHGYIQITIKRKRYFGHRLAWMFTYGYIPNEVDHINHNRSDNRIKNLREVTTKENFKNRTKQSNNTSGVTGVYFKKDRNKWRAQIKVEDKNIHLGYFVEFHEAVNARKNAEVLYGFHENHGKDI